MPETLYRKVGKRYVPCAVDQIGYQCGLWLVQEHGRERIYVGRLADVPAPLEAAALMARVNVAAGALRAWMEGNEWRSASDMARVVLLAAAKGGE